MPGRVANVPHTWQGLLQLHPPPPLAQNAGAALAAGSHCNADVSEGWPSCCYEGGRPGKLRVLSGQGAAEAE